MKVSQWSLIMQYFQACWVDFSSESLRELLMDRVTFGMNDISESLATARDAGYREGSDEGFVEANGVKTEMRGIDNVINHYEDTYFNVADSHSTKIISFSIREPPQEPNKPYFYSICAEYVIEQKYLDGNTYRAKVVEFFFPSKTEGKIAIINRTYSKKVLSQGTM